MDIQHLVDRLEDLIDEGRHMPFSKFTMIDEERALEIIDQMRISIPEEIEKAAKIIAQRDRVIAEANEKAARILQDAHAKGQTLLDQDVNVQAAQNRAANVVEEARQHARQITDEADNYVVQVLSKLEQSLQRNLNTVRNGINELSSQQPAPTPVQAAPQQASAPPQPAPVQKQPEMVEAGQQQNRPPGISLRRAQGNKDQG